MKTSSPDINAWLIDWDAANVVLRVIGECQARKQKLEAELQLEIQKLTKSAAARVQVIHETETAYRDALELFWAEHRKEVLPAKSKTMVFGTIGERQAKRAVKLLRGWTMAKVIAALGALGDYLTKPAPKLDKAAVLKAPPDDLALLAKCGVGIEEGGDRFFAEPDLKKIDV